MNKTLTNGRLWTVVLLVFQLIIGAAQGFFLIVVSNESERQFRVESRLDALEKFAAQGDRFTKIESEVMKSQIAERNHAMEIRISVIERDLDHIHGQHHPQNAAAQP